MLCKINGDLLRKRIIKDGRSVKEIAEEAGIHWVTLYRIMRTGSASRTTVEAVRRAVNPTMRASSIYVQEREEQQKKPQKPLESFTADKSKVRENISKINREREIEDLRREIKELKEAIASVNKLQEAFESKPKTLFQRLFS